MELFEAIHDSIKGAFLNLLGGFAYNVKDNFHMEVTEEGAPSLDTQFCHPCVTIKVWPNGKGE